LVRAGLKIRFVDTDLISQFPDQFEPYSFFGCTLQERFNGTLFRFPLRTADLARESEISKSR
jgi:sacsin